MPQIYACNYANIDIHSMYATENLLSLGTRSALCPTAAADILQCRSGRVWFKDPRKRSVSESRSSVSPLSEITDLETLKCSILSWVIKCVLKNRIFDVLVSLRGDALVGKSLTVFHVLNIIIWNIIILFLFFEILLMVFNIFVLEQLIVMLLLCYLWHIII